MANTKRVTPKPNPNLALPPHHQYQGLDCSKHIDKNKGSIKNFFGPKKTIEKKTIKTEPPHADAQKKLRTTTMAAFSSNAELKGAVDAYLKLSPEGDCSNRPHGPIAKWDSKHIDKNKGSIKDLFGPKKTTEKNTIKTEPPHADAQKKLRTTTMAAFSSNAELKGAVDAYLKLSPEGDCSNGPHGTIGEWDVSRVTGMSDVFANANYFKGDISKWDVSRVTSMSRMLMGAKSFNGDISKWDVSSVTSMSGMFSEASFNGGISKWDMSSVTDMAGMFSEASFNGDISKWDVSSAIRMNEMFLDAASFNGDVSKWDVSRVTSMSRMFMRATSFNADISKWDVSSASDMTGMFRQAKAFNCDLLGWDVSSVTAMDDMFLNAKSFKRKLCGDSWVNSKAKKINMFESSPGSISRTACMLALTPATTQSSHHYVSRRLLPGRELIVRTPISTPSVTSAIHRTITCPRCGTFRESGRVSCCAPGGAWFKNCGGLGSKNISHRWSEGVKACKRKFTTNNMQLYGV